MAKKKEHVPTLESLAREALAVGIEKREVEALFRRTAIAKLRTGKLTQAELSKHLEENKVMLDDVFK